MKVKRAVWAWLAAALAAFAIVMTGTNVALADAGDPPAHNKSSTPNGDGTHKIELTVTGDADDEEENDSHVNVLIIYDESSSMTNDNPSRADYAEDAMYTFVNGLIGYQNQGVDIAMAEVGFGTGSDTRSNWTTTLTTIRGHFDQGVDGQINRGSHGNYGYNGTNWASAFDRAEGLLGNLGSRSSYPTFVVLVTDGGPTAGGSGGTTVPGPNVPWTSYRSHYLAATGDANAIQNRENTTLYGIYAFGTDANLLDDLMYYANTGSHRTKGGYSIQNATQQQADFSVDDGAEHYYTANDAAALNAAISEIFNEIVEAMGITEVSMTDGTTSEVTASSGEVTNLLGVDEDSYQYWMTIPLDSNNQFKRTKNVNGSAEDITYTVGSDGTVSWTEGGASKSVKLDGTPSGGQFRFEWTADDFPNDFYEFAPNDAELVDGAVEWDLSNVGVLLDGVTYSVTFDVYPSQTALDYKARLDNGEAYNDVVPESAQDYFHADGSLETNTQGYVTYSDSRLDNPGPNTTSFTNPPAIATEAESMTVQKEWEGGNPPSEGLDVEVLMDDVEDPFETVTLSSGNSWSADIHISYGIIRNGKVMPDAPGHDFSFAELGPEQYRWELVAPTVHPMIIDGEKTMLIKVDENYPLGDHEPIEIDGEQYYIDEAVTSLKAVNHRRSNLNLTKVVTGEGAPEDATFPFEIAIENAKAEGGDPDDISSDAYVWFSIRDADNVVVKDATVSGATPEEGDTGYYYVESGETFTVEIQAGWNVRFINLPSGTTYTITEGDAPGFKFTKAESTGAEDETFEVEGKTAKGTIVTYNDKAYEVTVTNEYAAVDITVKKVWDDGGNKGGSRPDELTLTLNGLPEGTTATPTVTKDGDTWTYTWKGVPKYDDSGEVIEYTVSEDSIPDNYSCETTTVDPDGTITNTYTAEGEAEITVTKVLEGGEWPEGKTLTLTLKGSGSAPMPETTTVTLTAAGDATFEPIAFDLDDAGKTYTYTVSEDGFGTGWTGSPKSITVKIKVEDNGDGTLKTTVTYSPGATFTNTYKPEPVRIDPPIKKVVTGDTPPTDETFTFQMRAITDGAPMPEGSSNGVKTKDVKGAGEYEFGWIEYTEPGTYEYEVSEVAGSNSHYTYDSNKYTITVEVTDEGGRLVATVTGGEDERGLVTFTNIYQKPPKPPVVPKTGDETPQTGLLALFGAALLGYGVYRRRKA